MNIPRYKFGPVDYWLAEALTEFINGFIAGLGGGSVVGVGMGGVTTATSLGDGLSPLNKTLLAVSSTALTAVGNGLKRVIVWHNQHPFPNPWPRPVTYCTPTPPDQTVQSSPQNQ